VKRRTLIKGGNYSIFVSPGGRTPAFPDTPKINDDLAKKICKDRGVPPPQRP